MDTEPVPSPVDPDFARFRTEALASGYDEVTERQWPAGEVLPTHSHDFDVHAVVVQGEMWLTEGDSTRHLQTGDRFTLARGAPHAERYGPQGATYWVARRYAT